MKQWLEKQFKLSEFHSNVRTELLAGLTTFVTMAYVLATVPNMMESAGLDKHVMFTVLILLVILTTCAMAFYTNRPFALAPGCLRRNILEWCSVYRYILFGTQGSSGKSHSRKPETRSKCRYRPVYCALGCKELRLDHCQRGKEKPGIR